MAEIDTSGANRDEEYISFCLLLGRFFHSYTALEHEFSNAIIATVTRLTKHRIRMRIALAVLGGQRMSPLKETIKRLLRATDASKKRRDYVDAMLHQVGEIQFFRDRLAHYFTTFSPKPDTWVNLNHTGIREMDKLEDITFHISALDAAAEDMMKIRQSVGCWFSHYDRSGSARTPDVPTWRYKPSMLIRDRRKSSGSPKARKRPPRSSRG